MSAGFSELLIDWQKKQGRHDLPWQGTRDPYRIWLSEIMLQQTQVTTVLDYYPRFLARFPDLATLARAPLEAVLELWSGLGYYSRARNLHRCARLIVEERAGAFPDQPEELAQLPGIGRSTAAAIAAFAYGRRAAILDGNVKRVLCRIAGIDSDPARPETERKLWAIAEALLPAHGIEAYTQGLMDLGATVCLRRQPSCGRCPVADLCRVGREGGWESIPAPRRRAAHPERTIALLVLMRGKQVLLEERPQRGLWGGLLSLPEFPDAGPAELEAEILCRFGLRPAGLEPLQVVRHAFTHYRLVARPWRARLDEALTTLAEPTPAGTAANGSWRWLALDSVGSAALPRPIKRLLLGLT